MKRGSLILKENEYTDARLAFMSGLAQKAKEVDPTRLVSAACLVDEKNNKIAQLVINKVELVDIEEVNELDDTVRGEGGFGSTGTE